MKLAAAWLALAAIAAACARGAPSRAAEPAVERAPVGDVLVFGGSIYLGAPDWRPVDALLARDGIVLAVGSRAIVEALASPAARRVDLGGATAVPGLQDAHGHLEGLGRSLETLDLRGCASYGELVERVAERARTTRRGEWIEGRGWDQNLWKDPAFPHHAELSARVPDHPVVLRRVDGHALVEVADDGVGGADPETGSGLRGLADRVEALEGRLEVVSPPGEGTRIRAEIPLR